MPALEGCRACLSGVGCNAIFLRLKKNLDRGCDYYDVCLYLVHSQSFIIPFLSISLPVTSMTFAVLRALHAIIGDALDDIQRVYAPNPFPDPRAPTHSLHTEDGKKSPYASPPLTPSSSTYSSSLDFPSLDLPYDSVDPAEQLTTHPAVVVASNKIVAAAGHMAAIVQTPFLSLCDASMAVRIFPLLKTRRFTLKTFH
jgi:hypothetical protein